MVCASQTCPMWLVSVSSRGTPASVTTTVSDTVPTSRLAFSVITSTFSVNGPSTTFLNPLAVKVSL